MPHSKELLDVRGTPIMGYLVSRMESCGCSAIRVVTRPEKSDVRAFAISRGLDVVLGKPPNVGASVTLALEGIPKGEILALGYPDTLWEPLNGFALLREGMDAETDVVLGLFETPDAYRSDVVRLDERGRVIEILVKPAMPPSSLVWGCLVGRVDALAAAACVAEIGEGLAPLMATGRVGSYFLSERWLDVGTPAALARARSHAFPAVSLAPPAV
jgi:dTDP-glucose pyrophosphorylase